MEGKESRAHSMMEEFQFTGDTPALYYAQAAWEYKHNNAQKGRGLDQLCQQDLLAGAQRRFC